MADIYIDLPPRGSASWKDPVTNSGLLPATNNILGDARIVESSPPTFFVWDGSSWQQIGSGGGGGSVTAVTASGPLASSGGTAPNISLTGIIPVVNGGLGLSGALTAISTTSTISALAIPTSYIYHTPSTNTTIQGIVNNGTAQKLTYAVGPSSNEVILQHESSSATAANRLALPDQVNFTVSPGQTIQLIYNTTTSRWNLQELKPAIIANQSAALRNIYSQGAGVPGGSNSVLLGNGAGSAGPFAMGKSVMIGFEVAKNSSASSSFNTVVGAQSVQTGSFSGSFNTIFGANNSLALTTGAVNTIVGSSCGSALTTGNTNILIGQQAGFNLTSGSENICIGNNVGGTNATGGFNFYMGSQIATSGNLGNTAAIGHSITVQSSNTFLLGGTGNPMNVGINNDNPQYRLDVGGSVNATQGYYLNGVDIAGWGLLGNAGTSAGTNFLGTTDSNPLEIRTNNTFVATFTASGRFGVQAGPLATIHAGVTSEGIGGPPASLNYSGISVTTSGYAFGTGNKNYAVYSGGVVSGVTVYSTTSASLTFTEPASTDFNITSPSVTSQDTASTGYDPLVDPTPSYQIWAIYSGAQDLNPQSIALSSWPVTVTNQDVLIQWTAPTLVTPASYFIVRNGTDYQTTSDIFLLDTNSGWTAGTSPGLPDIHYQVYLSYPTAGASFYRVLNTTTGTYIDDTVPTLSVVDDSLWASGSTVTPTSAQLPGLKTDADTINVAGSRTVTNSTDAGATGDICWDANYIYVCIASNTWKRTAITTW